MNLLHRIIYTFLSLKKKSLEFRLDKHLKASVTNSTSKTVIAGNCSLTLNTETNKNIELVKTVMSEIVKNAGFTSDYLLKIFNENNIKITYLKDCHKILALLGEEQGLILERSGMDAFLINLLSGIGFSFKSKPVLVLEKGNNDFYFLLFNLYKLQEYLYKLPGLDEKSQFLFKINSKYPEKCDISNLGLEEMTALKEAIARDNEATSFVIEYSKQRDNAKKLLSRGDDKASL